MPGRRYPRPGWPLAPRALAEVLQDPLPPEYVVQDGCSAMRYCDLDERAWSLFDEATCRRLASRIVQLVSRAARQPAPFTGRTLPPFPAGLSLSDLELEARTFNCLVAAGIEDRPQDLGRMTIEGVLSLRGFWGKCLVDLLTAIEHAADHPESRPQGRDGKTSLGRNRQKPSRYPRHGYRLAPATLREILDLPVPAHRIKNPAVRGLRLCDLDEKVSAQLTDLELAQLGRLIIARVNASGHKRGLSECSIPALPDGMRLRNLALENRTYRCLVRAGFDAHPEDLAKHTVGDLLGLKAFGAKCLLDLLSSLETALARSGSLDDALTHEAVALGAMPEIAGIHFSDPRLGRLLRAADREADTLGELAGQLIKRRVDPPEPAELARRLAEIRRQIGCLQELSLGEELADVFWPSAHWRDRQIVAEYYGWDGMGNRTLEELGRRNGLSRERIRQVCTRAAKRHSNSRVFAPVLDRTIGFITSRIPLSADALRREFERNGRMRDWLPPAVVRQAATFLTRPVAFDTVTVGCAELVVKPGTSSVPKTISQAARRIALASGIATTAEVVRQVEVQSGTAVDSALVRVTLEALLSFHWLDDRHVWFQLEASPQYGLPNMIEKVLSVCPRIEISRLRAALKRHRRSSRAVPPSRVLSAFCGRMPGVRIEGRMIIADPPRETGTVLIGVEAAMVDVLRRHGPVLERGVFEERCRTEGVNRFSFNAVLMSSPVIHQFGRSVYGLIGAAVSRRKTLALAARGQDRCCGRVLRGFGELGDGRLFLSYQLSKGAIDGGVTTVPAALRDTVEGCFGIRTSHGVAAGQLVARDGCAWGLGPALRSQRALPGDHMVLLVDREARLVDVFLGEQDLLDTLVESLSLQVARTFETQGVAAFHD